MMKSNLDILLFLCDGYRKLSSLFKIQFRFFLIIDSLFMVLFTITDNKCLKDTPK